MKPRFTPKRELKERNLQLLERNLELIQDRYLAQIKLDKLEEDYEAECEAYREEIELLNSTIGYLTEAISALCDTIIAKG